MEGFRDSRSTMILRGIVIPVVLLCLALYNLQAWTVWLPARRLGGRIGGLTSLTSNHFVIGIVLVKLGFAGAMHSWYLLANLRRTERFAQLWMAIGLAVSIAGILTVLAGAFRL